jgi:isoleucyl-tRNA synthetase/bisphosphoglycerate-dependent phosphoglycerate mutase
MALFPFLIFPYTHSMFDPIDPRQSFPDLERGILSYWKEEDIFKRSITHRNGAESFSFYDGPPFATGLPHYGHLLAGTIKDVIPRYQTMKGKRVERRFGWDCHGLPVEYEIEKEHGIKSSHEIQEMGVGVFNDLCRGIVQRYAKEWRATVERMGRFVDMDHDYRTMDPDYMESIWWVFKSLYEKGLIYEGYKPMQICPRCSTPLSNFEVTQGYKDITDQSATVKFELIDEPGTFVLAWTTTPWTLPGNLFLAVHPETDYVKVQHEGHTYILAEGLVSSVFDKREYAIVGSSFKGNTLKGKFYKPLFPYFVDQYKDAFKIVTAEFVTTVDGTGVVHIAPGFGEDDFNLGKEIYGKDYKPLQHVSMDGHFIPAVKDFPGIEAKPKDDSSKTDKKVIQWLKEHDLLFSDDAYRHSYPHCWRCETPLLNYATSSWFVNVDMVKQDMLLVNKESEWVPAHLRDGRFGNWLENARDWAISRNRYWGTPLPIWRTDDKSDIDVITSREDLMAHKKIRFTKVSVLRHGQSEGNLIPMYQSVIPGTKLTALGEKQAEKAAVFLASGDLIPTVVYSSPIGRARQTAEAVVKATGATLIIDERLREVGMGEHEGKTIPIQDLEVSKELRKEKTAMGVPQSTFHLPGMEPWDSVQERIDSFFEEILPKHRSEHIVVVSHGDPILNIRHHFTQEDPMKLVHIDHDHFATPHAYFWDHAKQAQMDLHKHIIDDITWTGSASEKTVALTLVRHGQTDLNKAQTVQGSEIDAPLNQEGHAQAAALAATLKKGDYDVIVSSHLKRAVETADYLAKALGIAHEEKLEVLRERDLGEWSGKQINDIAVAFPAVMEGIYPGMNHHTPKDGESLSAFLQRAEEALEMLRSTYAGKHVLVVAHGGFMQALRIVAENRPYSDAPKLISKNTEVVQLALHPVLKRIPDVLDCWFESGSMPYAQNHFPFEMEHEKPVGFPADFIAEGIDQTRGWFYTLTVLSAALFKKPAFVHCIVNGTVLAENGLKMSKRLKNYPDPNGVMEKFGADALRFTLMNSQAVRAEDLRFSEKAVEETIRSVILPLWNSYSFFVTYANAAVFEPSAKPNTSKHPLDLWIRAEVQDLVNRMTQQMDQYDLSATCNELGRTIDALTNWYIRLSRRRFAGKNMTDTVDSYVENNDVDRQDALTTLYDVLVTVSQLLAPFCPFVTESIYLNLTAGKHHSIHLTDWPATRELTQEEDALIRKNHVMRLIVRLGNKIRSEKKIKVRQPLSKTTIAIPVSLLKAEEMTAEDLKLLRQELNVKEISFTDDAGSLGESIAMVDARKAGPRFGGRVQELIQAGKRGEFMVQPTGEILILDAVLSPEEVQILYRGREGEDVGAEGGVVVSMETVLNDALIAEGYARDLIRSIQKLRKETGLAHTDRILLSVVGMDDVMASNGDFILEETKATLGDSASEPMPVDIEDKQVTIRFHKI